MSTSRSEYHHGDLRRALLDALADAVLDEGPAAVSLRAIARRAGVSHAAPAHHFGDKRGLLTAFAADGHRRLAAALREAAVAHPGDFTEVGLAYVRFALEHRAHFEVMFRPELLDRDDPELAEAARASSAELRAGAAAEAEAEADTRTARARAGAPADPDPDAAMLAAWSLVHGFATLWLSGNVPQELGDPLDLARRIADAVGSSSA